MLQRQTLGSQPLGLAELCLPLTRGVVTASIPTNAESNNCCAWLATCQVIEQSGQHQSLVGTWLQTQQ
jgi:hypothetical protein